MVDTNSAVPLYRQIAEDIKKRIEQGEFQQDKCIPSEVKLCEQYEVSRVTVRNAIAELVEQEILVARHGKGVFVKAPKISSSLNSFKGFTYFCEENHISVYTKMLSTQIQKATMTLERKLELEQGAEIIYLKRLRCVHGKPVMIEHVYLPYEKFSFLENIDMENKSLYEEIEKHTGLHLEGNCYTAITLETSLTTEEEQELMQLKEPNAVFILTETVFMQTGKPVHVTKQVLSGDYFKFFLSNKANQLSMNWNKI